MARQCDLAVGGPRCVGGDSAYSQHFFPYYFVMSSMGSNMIFFVSPFKFLNPVDILALLAFFFFCFLICASFIFAGSKMPSS